MDIHLPLPLLTHELGMEGSREPVFFQRLIGLPQWIATMDTGAQPRRSDTGQSGHVTARIDHLGHLEVANDSAARSWQGCRSVVKHTESYGSC